MIHDALRGLALILALATPRISFPQDAQPSAKSSLDVHRTSQPATAQVYPHRHALVIGINKYAADNIPTLSYAEDDAREMAAVLKDLYGFDDIRVLLGAEATQSGINAALAEMFDPKRIGKDDAVLIYFSGHGQTVRQGDQESGYLIPQDAPIVLSDVNNPAVYRRYAIRMDDLRTDADGIPAKHVLFLIDACYSGYLASRAVDSSPAIESALKYPARQVITAGTKGEQAVEHNAWGHGAFTYKMLQILRAEEQPLQASLLGAMLKKGVPFEVAAKFGDQRTLSPQAKYLSGEGDFVFVRVGVTIEIGRSSASSQPATTPESARTREQQQILALLNGQKLDEARTALLAYQSRYGTDSFVTATLPKLRPPEQFAHLKGKWRGTIEGNTKTDVTIIIEEAGAQFRGRLQWSARRSEGEGSIRGEVITSIPNDPLERSRWEHAQKQAGGEGVLVRFQATEALRGSVNTHAIYYVVLRGNQMVGDYVVGRAKPGRVSLAHE